jgi:hypothetical protein
MSIESIFLERVHRDGGLQHVLKINEAKVVLSTGGSCLLYQADTLKARKGTKNI